MGKVIFLTGAPATGKTTLSMNLKTIAPNLRSIDYGELLLLEKRKTLPNLTYSELRARSSEIVTAEDVQGLDERLIEWVNNHRNMTNVLIDTHSIVRADFGYRMTPFTYTQVISLNLDAVVSLHCDPQVMVDRINARAEGRKQVSLSQAQKHSYLQDNVALLYGVLCGCPTYFLDSSDPPEILAQSLFMLLSQDIGLH